MGSPVRRYKIEITGGDTYDSAPNGQPDPGALQVDMDISVAPNDVPGAQGAYVRVWGIGIQALSQAKDLFNKKIKVSGGFSQGLPLENPQQYGLLVQGIITKAFGNWIGVDQSLDLYISADNDTPKADGGPNPKPAPKNITLNFMKGKNLPDVVKQALQTAYPGMSVNTNVNQQIIAPQDLPGFFGSVQELAYYVRRISQDIVGNNYQGLSIVDYDGQFTLSDSANGGKNIKFEELIGQPTWIDTGTIQFRTPMRSDIKISDKVTMPQTWVNSSEAGNYIGGQGINQQLAFKGDFQITRVRHIGFSRQPSGEAWATVFDAAAQTGGGGQ